MKAREKHGMAIASYLESLATKRDTMKGIMGALGLSYRQFRGGLQWFRRHGGVTLGYTVVCDDAVDEYVLCDEFGQPILGDTLIGYDLHLNKGITSRLMTALSVSITAYNRAVINGDMLAMATMKRRVRGLWDVLETYSDAAEQVGDLKERDRIENFLDTLVRP